MATRPKLTIKEAKLVQGIVAGKTKRQAAIDAYDVKTPETASAIATETLKRPNVQEALAEAFKRHGIDIDSVVKPVADALKAEKVSIVGQGDQAFAEVTPDHSIRLKAAGMAHGLMGIGKQTGDVTINFIDASQHQKVDYDL